MIRRPPRSTLDRSSAASDVYKRQLLDQYRRVLQRHEIQIDWTKLEAFVVTSVDDSQRFTPFPKNQSASLLFSVKPRKLALLDSESTVPGSIVAFVTQAKSMFSS